MVVFALVNSENSGGYYIASNRAEMGWRGLPHDLAREIENTRQKGEEVGEVSIGLNGDWFLRTDRRHAYKHNQVGSMSNVEHFEQLAQNSGMDLAHYAIQSFSFVPDTTGYVTVFHKVDGSLIQCAWHNVPPELDRLLEREASKGVRRVAVGVNGSYVVILNTGVVWWNGVPEPLSRLLKDLEKSGRIIATVALSLISASWFFIQFADGTTEYSLPSDWHDSVNSYTALAARHNGLKIGTSYSSPYGPSSDSTPFASNPYLAPVFTGAPPPMFAYPPAPTYYFTNVYNTAPQPQTTATPQNNDAKFELLGGVVKVAAAILVPLLTSGIGLGTTGIGC